MSYLRKTCITFIILTSIVRGHDDRSFAKRPVRTNENSAIVNSGIPDTIMTVPIRLAVSIVDALPSGHRMVVFGKARYYFFDGVWYLS